MSPRSAFLGCLALVVTSTFAGTPSDPILGEYAGNWSAHHRAFLDGRIDPSGSYSEVSGVALQLQPDGFAMVVPYQGHWKQRGAKYRINCSKYATEFTIATSGDPHATGAVKAKSIERDALGAIHGRIAMAFRFRFGGKHVKLTTKGPFAAAKTT